MCTEQGHPPPYVSLKDRLKSANRVKEEWDALESYRNYAASLAFALLVTANLTREHFKQLFLQDFDIFLLGQGLVGAWLIFLALLWIWNGTAELGYLQTWVQSGHYQSKRPFIVLLTFIGLAAIFGLMIIVSYSVQWFFLVNCIYLMLDIYTWKLRRDEIKSSLNKAQMFLTAEKHIRLSVPHTSSQDKADIALASIYLDAIEIIRTFYFARRHVTRISLTLAPMLLLLAISVWIHWELLSSPIPDLGNRKILPLLQVDQAARTVTVSLDLIRFAFYVLYIFIMVVSELIVYHWRGEMRSELGKLDAKLFEQDLKKV